MAKRLIDETGAPDDDHRAYGRLRQHPPVQRRVPARVSKAADVASTIAPAASTGRGQSLQAASGLSSAVRLAGDARVPARPRGSRRRARRWRHLSPHHRVEGIGRHAGGGPPPGCACARRADRPARPDLPPAHRRPRPGDVRPWRGPARHRRDVAPGDRALSRTPATSRPAPARRVGPVRDPGAGDRGPAGERQGGDHDHGPARGACRRAGARARGFATRRRVPACRRRWRRRTWQASG